MATPARDAAWAEQEQGTGSLPPGAQHSQFPAPVEARAAIAHLQQRVRAWTDGDRLFPADGSCLLAALDQALEGLSGKSEPATRAAMENFMRRVEGLREARMIADDDSQPLLEAAALLIAGLPGTGGIDRAARGANRDRRDRRRRFREHGRLRPEEDRSEKEEWL